MIEDTEIPQQAEAAPTPTPTPEPAPADYQHRVREEHDELESKYARLLHFLRDRAHGVEQREVQLLKDQAEAMHKYLLVLKARIASWL